MYFKKSIFTLFLTISIFSTTYAMDLISKETLQDKIITPAIILGIGAASGAAQAIIMNKINTHYHAKNHWNISKNAILGALFAIPATVIATAEIDSLPKLDNEGIIWSVASSTTYKMIICMGHYYFIKKAFIEQNNFFNTPEARKNRKTTNDLQASNFFQSKSKHHSAAIFFLNPTISIVSTFLTASIRNNLDH